MNMAPKIVVLTGDGAESLEVMYPYQRLLEEGYEVHLAAPSVKRLQFVVHDFEDGFDTYTEKPGYCWTADVSFADIDPTDYAAVVIPGGRAPEYIRNNTDCQQIVRHFIETGKPMATICHGPQVLAAVGGLSDRQSAAYPALKPDVCAAGADFVDEEVVVDGALVSARAWPDHPGWMREFMRLLRAAAPVNP
jgi:protease I